MKSQHPGKEAKGGKYFEDYLPFAASAAKRFFGKGIPEEEIIQLGYIGMWNAWEGFDEKKGVPFTAYAFPFIEGRILREFRRARKERERTSRLLPDGAAAASETADPFKTEALIIEKICLKDAVMLLPERERALIKLRFFCGLRQKDAARILKVSQPSISKTQKKAIDALKMLIAINEQNE